MNTWIFDMSKTVPFKLDIDKTSGEWKEFMEGYNGSTLHGLTERLRKAKNAPRATDVFWEEVAFTYRDKEGSLEQKVLGVETHTI